VVREQENIFVYHNLCPHTGIPLEWQPDQFFDLGKAFLQCATHGALFRSEDGYCVRGPCAGDSLQAIPFQINNGQIFIV
jgi:nitrite reductase/ring-hydroxylating ferredoxin subunit